MSSIANPVNSVLPATPDAAPTTSASAPPAIANGLGNEETFLKLLVSQLQNQDPLSPTDSNQFVAQLTSYSQLEQLIGIHKDTTALSQPSVPTPSSAGSGNAVQTTTNTGAN
jgi:flagellar basal-body rod modification protein FlgD